MCTTLSVGKEYSKCDWRYVGRDSTVVAIETFTAFVEGPGCLLLAWTIVGPRVNWRWPVQILVSGGQVRAAHLFLRAFCFMACRTIFKVLEPAPRDLCIPEMMHM